MFALYLLLAVAGLTAAVPATLQVANGAVLPRFTAASTIAFFCLTAGLAGLLAEQFDVGALLSLVAVVPLGIAGGLLHFELFQTLAKRNGHPTAAALVAPADVPPADQLAE